jgi:MoaA/NifB/PqqE/SkfB family radical SAM enzyme
MCWWLSIDLQFYCNRDCEYCPRYYDRSRIRKDENEKKIRKKMPTEKVYSIINRASKLGFKGIVCLHKLSEPLLDSRYLEFAIYVKKMSMKFHDDTNGDVLKNNPDLYSKLDDILDLIYIHLSDHKSHSEMNQEKIYWRSKFKKTKVRFSTPSEQQMIMQNSKTYYETEKTQNT